MYDSSKHGNLLGTRRVHTYRYLPIGLPSSSCSLPVYFFRLGPGLPTQPDPSLTQSPRHVSSGSLNVPSDLSAAVCLAAQYRRRLHTPPGVGDFGMPPRSSSLRSTASTSASSYHSSLARVYHRAQSAIASRRRAAAELTEVAQGIAAVLTSLLYFKQK